MKNRHMDLDLNAIYEQWKAYTAGSFGDPGIGFTNERALFDAGMITECQFEFGPHTEHSDCERMLNAMVDDGYEEDYYNVSDEFGNLSYEA